MAIKQGVKTAFRLGMRKKQIEACSSGKLLRGETLINGRQKALIWLHLNTAKIIVLT